MPDYHFRWDVVVANLPFLLSGVWMTLFISAITLAASVVLGLVVAVADMSHFWPLRVLGRIWGEVVRKHAYPGPAALVVLCVADSL